MGFVKIRSMIEIDKIYHYINNQKEGLKKFMEDLIGFQSVQGKEEPIQSYLLSKFKGLGLKAEFIPIDNKIKDDPEYTFSEKALDYDGRYNLIITKKGSSNGRSIILNAHSDVVPANEWTEGFSPLLNGDIITGRGACDDKGQIGVIYAALSALEALKIDLKGDILTEIVIEEEVGGNGSLDLIRKGYKADGVLVLEPTEFQIHPANRGVIWFRVTVEGKPVHMGRILEGVSAIDHVIEVIKLFKKYEKRLIKESKGHPLFKMHKQPVQLNVGTMQAGEWPSMVPAKAVIEGGVGFLPNKSMGEVKKELKQIIEESGSEWLKGHYRLEFLRLHNDAFEIPIDHPFVTTLEKSCKETGLNSKVSGWIVSCDARLFNKVGNMPTVVFGAGSLSHAHSNVEQINVQDIMTAAKALAVFLINWCGDSSLCSE